jgi:hypothetical protein
VADSVLGLVRAGVDDAEIVRLEPAMTDDPVGTCSRAPSLPTPELVVALNLDHFPNEACEPVGVGRDTPTFSSSTFSISLPTQSLLLLALRLQDRALLRPRGTTWYQGHAVLPASAECARGTPSHESTRSSFGPLGQRPSGASAVEPAVRLRDLRGMTEGSCPLTRPQNVAICSRLSDRTASGVSVRMSA